MQRCPSCDEKVPFKPTCSKCGATLIPENLKPKEKKGIGISKGRQKTGRNKQASQRNRKNKKNKKSKKSIIDPVPRPGTSVLEKNWFDKKAPGAILTEIENLAKSGSDQDLITIICASRIQNEAIQLKVFLLLETFGYERVIKIVKKTHISRNWSENIFAWLSFKEAQSLDEQQLSNFDGSGSVISRTAVSVDAYKAYETVFLNVGSMEAYKVGETSVERAADAKQKQVIVQDLINKAETDQPALVELICAMRDKTVERVVKGGLENSRISWRRCKKVYEDFPNPNWPPVFIEWLRLQEEADRKKRLEKRQKDSIMPDHADYGVADI